MEDKTNLVKRQEEEYQEMEIEFEQLKDEFQSAQDETKERQLSLKDLRASINLIEQEYEEIKERHQEAITHLEAEKSKLLGLNEEIKSLESTLTFKTKFFNENKLQVQKVKHHIDKITSEIQTYKNHISKLERDHSWILEESEFLGKPNTPYYFDNVDIHAVRDELHLLSQRIVGLKKGINIKVMNMIENVEKKEIALKTMIRTIERDKSKIEETIVSLDDYKKSALINTWHKVTKDFGKVFGDLLPGSNAKLVAADENDVSKGLEIKVSLGSVWKDSLAELSGGQRSLVALSLILALLQFKPAPMYILDEVDAALDLSHTQNIGQLIKTRFKGSQFIVVSLKEGMFTNANRVFRTRFQEGTSSVSVM